MGADLLVLLSDVEGIYTGNPSDSSSRLIRTYYPEHSTDIKFFGKSRVGRGGMESKVTIATVLSIRYLVSKLILFIYLLIFYLAQVSHRGGEK